MYGWINVCVEDLIVSVHGQDVWNKVLREAKCCGDFVLGVHYDDKITYQLISTASSILKISAADLLEQVGANFVHFVDKRGFQNLLTGQANSFVDWIQSINEPHRIIGRRFPEGSLPEFRSEFESSDRSSMILHYYSTRSDGLGPVVVGVVQEVAKKYFSQNVLIEQLKSEALKEGDFAHYTAWRVYNIRPGSCRLDIGDSFPQLEKTGIENHRRGTSGGAFNEFSKPTTGCPFHAAFRRDDISPSTSLDADSSSIETPHEPTLCPFEQQKSSSSNCVIGAKSFRKIFPFHVVLDQNLRILQVGNKLNDMMREMDVCPLGRDISSIFSLKFAGGYEWSWKCLEELEGSAITVRLHCNDKNWEFSGEIAILDDDGAENAVAALLINPSVISVNNLRDMNIKLSELPRHSFQREILHMEDQILSEVANTQRMTELSNRLERESRKSREALQMKRIFVRYVSHEVRTPLNVASLGLKYVEDVLHPNRRKTRSHSVDSNSTNEDIGLMDPKPLLDVFDDIQDSCNLAVDILNDLLLYEKIDAGIFTISASPIALPRVLLEAEKLFALLSKGSGVLFSSDGHLSPALLQSTVVDIDRSKFHQVLRNLFTNAIKFTPPKGTVSISVGIFEFSSAESDEGINFGVQANDRVSQSQPISTEDNSDRDESLTCSSKSNKSATPMLSVGEDISLLGQSINGAFLRLSIVDNGCGISQEHQEHLFREFIQVQADKLQNGLGSGLGLWICMNIMHMHKGRIGVSSAGEGLGTRFILDLPLSGHSLQSIPSSPSVFERDLDISSPFTPRKSSPPHDGFSIVTSGTSPSTNVFSALTSTISHVLSSPRSRYFSQQPQSRKKSFDTALNLKNCAAAKSSNNLRSPRSQFNLFDASLTSKGALTYTDKCKQSRILIVDDAPLNRKMVRKVLHGHFLDFDEAEDGQQACDKYAAALSAGNKYDLVLMDFMMPVMNGLDASRWIKSLDAQAVIVGVTGNGLDHDIAAFKDAGVKLVLVKPLRLELLEQYLSQLWHVDK